MSVDVSYVYACVDQRANIGKEGAKDLKAVDSLAVKNGCFDLRVELWNYVDGSVKILNLAW